MVVDHTTSAAMGSPYHRIHQEVREFAQQNKVENFFGPGSGLRHLVLTERGFARPGMLIFSDEPNIASIGALGALNMPVSWEVVVTLIGDENWVAVPKSARIDLTGSLPFGVAARDLAQLINRDFGNTDRLLQTCVEYAGAITGLSLDDRQSLLSCAYHAGADTAIMQADDKAVAYAAQRAAGRPYFCFEADPDAQYSFRTVYDLAVLSPMVTVPPEMSSVVEVGELQGLRIDQATIGSCASNRLDDLRAAATILRGRKIARHVTMYISPGSREIYAAAAREGLLEIFMDAGATVLAPGCNTCWGYLGVLGDGQVSISTHQFNYQGRNGSRSAKVHLGGPYVVAASAVAGSIVDPRPMLAARAGRLS
jgi:3-isopropylmalate/(R)-2-methylmalate dehydratase large subunit